MKIDNEWYEDNPLMEASMPAMSLPQNPWAQEEELEMDKAYLRRVMPDIAREIIGLVDDECDQLEYKGSCMFDQYPDKVTIQNIGDRICDKMQHKNRPREEMTVIVQIMLCNEMYDRRRRYNCRCRMFD